MRIQTGCLVAGLIPLLVSCASQPIALAPVGPGPAPERASSPLNGDLQVFTETEEYYLDEMSYFVHKDYELYTQDGRRFKHVWNHDTHEDEQPTVVTLPPGNYVVQAQAEFYGPVSVPVVIRPGQTTKVILQPGWQPGKGVARTELVQIPNGYYVGWRAPANPASPEATRNGR